MAEYSFKLKITGPDGFNLDFDLPVGITRIGRQPGNDIVLQHSQVSRGHARIETTTTECHLTDLGSSNGTLLNGEKLAANAPASLNDGDQIRLGVFEISFNSKEVKKESRPAPQTPKPEADPSIVDEILPPEEVPAKKADISDQKQKKKAETAAPKKRPPQKDAETRSEKKRPPADPTPPPPAPPPSAAPAAANGHPADIPGLSIHSRRLLPYLPGIYHTDFMSRFLGIFEATLLPLEWTIDHFDLFLSPNTAPADFLPWLAGWFGITFDSTWNEEQRRILLSEAHEIYARRGTAWALRRVLEIYTGIQPEIEDQDDKLEPFTFEVTLPVSRKDFDPSLIEALIEAHKPAHTNYTLRFKR